MKLHLGCGSINIPGYINVDIRYLPGVDVVDNAMYLRKFKRDTVDEIYACHVIEHFCRWDISTILKRWYDVLNLNGVLVLAVPNFEALVTYCNKTKDIESIKGLLYGGQDYPENHHHNCWDFNSLSTELKHVGFCNISRYDWKESAVFSSFDDYSKCYVPHKDFDNGTLMSLNIIAYKK